MTNQTEAPEVRDPVELVAQIRGSEKDKNQIVVTALKTDERVIARVTDGIYRQPASALRELISNAYDADATRVVITTDAPRFDRIVVEDNGHGMTPETLAHLLFHIGGSAKRSDIGKGLGVTAASDSSYSPNGRKLIGKIGIGLFSVSQLTHAFQIVTKVKGDHYRTVATITLRQYADSDQQTNADGKTIFESGKVKIWREKAADVSAHGTTIVLTNIRPQAKNTLRSLEVWSVIEQNDGDSTSEEHPQVEPPPFHIGRVDSSGQLLTNPLGQPSLPWSKEDSQSEAFHKLVEAVWRQLEESNPNPQLDRLFDYYLRMIWQLSLAVPLPYVGGHVFDTSVADWGGVFELSNKPKGSARRIQAKGSTLLREELALADPVGTGDRFNVYFDDLELLRPVKFKGLPQTGHALKKPLVFLGKCREDFASVPRELSGGPLAFEAYLVWTPKVAPTEHQGSLVRIHGSSGTLFDPTFMRYQVSEQTRLRQITCEIFVSEGLDSALNIDRESFNNAHPHAVYITKWLHSALRQLATAQKKLSSEAREHTRGESKGAAVSGIQQIAVDTWAQETQDPASMPPSIEISNSEGKSSKKGAYVFPRSIISVERVNVRGGKAIKVREEVLEEKLKAITQVLASFGLLDFLNRRKQESLLKAIYKILKASDE